MAAAIAGSVGGDVGEDAVVWRRAFVKGGALSSLLALFEGKVIVVSVSRSVE